MTHVVENVDIVPATEEKEFEDVSSDHEVKIETGEAALATTEAVRGAAEQVMVSLQYLEQLVKENEQLR